jgi:hyperosmotically inducible periplasmic protein
MRRFNRAVVVGCLLASAAWLGLAQNRGGRYDQQINSNVARVLLSDKDYKDVSVQVEDGIVTLTGSVALDSTRRNLAVQIGHLSHVAGVDNQVVLSPPAPPDQILYGRVMSRLQEAGYGDLTAQVHEGAVVLKGYVRTQRDWSWAREIVMLTPGVKEVETRLSIVSP